MSSKNIEIEILHKDKNCNARYGLLKTPHGTVELPMFMPVGTLATVKSLSPKELKRNTQWRCISKYIPFSPKTWC